jgi:hypothetical protein
MPSSHFPYCCPQGIATSFGPIRVMINEEAVGNGAGAAGHTPEHYTVSAGVQWCFVLRSATAFSIRR